MKWEKAFEFSAPVGAVWESFTNRESEHRVWDPENAYQSGGAIRVEFTAVETNSVIAWKELQGDDVLTEMTVVFNETDSGTRITITSEGFAIPDFMHESRMRGWTEVLWDLELYFRTGRMLNRLHHRKWGRLGLSASGRGYGLAVVGVGDGTPAAQAGIEKGDLIVTAGGAPVYETSDLWLLESVLPANSEIEFVYFRDKELLSGTGRVA